MPHLLLDIGNTRAKFALSDNGKLILSDFVDLNHSDTLHSLCDIYHPDAAIASVVGNMPDFNFLLPSPLASRLHLLSCNSRLPITIDYDTPQSLGMDRVAACIGARTLCKDDALMVVDAGTCITIDILDDSNCYRGGAILPGLNMRLRALHDFTAALPLVEPDSAQWDGSQPVPLAGKSTRNSILSGVLNATLFEIQSFTQQFNNTYPSLKLFLTGGNADFFAKQLFFPNFANSNLLFLGLDKILEMNL